MHRNVQNMIGFSIISQVVIILSPLLAFVNLSAKANLQEYGHIYFIYAVTQILILIFDYGFSVSSLFELRAIKSRRKKYKIIFDIHIFKFKIFFLCLLPICFLLWFIKMELSIILLIVATVWVSTQTPSYYFQNEGRFSQILIYNLLGKIAYVGGVVLIIGTFMSVKYFIFFLFVGSAITCILTWLTILNQEKYWKHVFFISLRFSTKRYILETFLQNFNTFASRFFAGFKSNASIIILAGQDPAITAIYGMYDQAFRGINAIFNEAVNNVLLPLALNARSLYQTFIVVLATIFLIVFAGFILIRLELPIMTVIFGENFQKIDNAMTIVILISITNFLSIVFGFPLLGRINRKDLANYSVYLSGFIFALIVGYYIVNSYTLSVINLLFIALLSEAVLFASRGILFIFNRNGDKF